MKKNRMHNMRNITRNEKKNEILQLIQLTNVDSSVYNKNCILSMIFKDKNISEKDGVELIKIFLDRGGDPNIKKNEEFTALHMAVCKRWKDMVDFLIKYNADISICDKVGNSIAHLFIEDERRQFLELFELTDRISMKVDTKKMERESGSFVEWLISKGFDFDRKNINGKSALHLSVDYDLNHILIKLLKYTRDIIFIDNQSKTLLHLFIENMSSNSGYINNVLRNNWYTGYMLRYAKNIVKLLLDKGVLIMAVNFQDRTCIQQAIERRLPTSIIDILINDFPKENDLTTKVFLELFKTCAVWGDERTDYFLKTLQVLITKGAEVNARDRNGITALYYSFQAANSSAVHFLSCHNADFSEVTSSGDNLYHALAESEDDNRKIQKSLFNLLLSKGCCDLNATNTNHETPLYLATRMKNYTIIHKLIENDADVNCQNKYRPTPLLRLLLDYNEREELIKLLPQRGAEVNTRDFYGRRALHYTVVPSEIKDTLRLLLKYGAYVNARASGKSPFSIAIERGYLSYASDMLEYGADINDLSIVNLIVKSKLEIGTMTFMLQHWVRLKAVQLPCSKEYETLFQANDYQQFYADCLVEVEKLKSTFIDKYNSIFAFLHMDFVGRRSYLQNEKLNKIVNSRKLKQIFPRYSEVVLASYREAVMWKTLVEPAKQAWIELTDIVLPELCIERILGYLSIQDLVNIVEYEE